MQSLEELSMADRTNRAGDFASLVRNIARARGNWFQAAAMAEKSGAARRTVDCLKAAVVAGGGADGWGTELNAYRTLVSGFVDALRQSSVFYRMLGDGSLIRLPFDARIGSIASAAGAGVVEPGAAISMQRLNLASVLLERRKAAAMLALTEELLDAGGSAAEGLISRSLRASVGTAVDAEFVSVLMEGVTPSTATADAGESLRALLLDANLTDASRPYFVAAADVAIILATLQPAGSGFLFPSAGFSGGTLLGAPLLVSSGVTAGQLLLVDASGIAGASDSIAIDTSRHSSLQFDTEPTMATGGSGSPAAPVATATISTWQTNSVAIRALAYFGAAKLRAGSVVALESIAWGMGSP